MLAILFAVVAYIGWATGDIFVTFASRKVGSISASLWIYVLSLTLAAAYLPFSWQRFGQLSIANLLLIIGLGAFFALAYVSFIEALRIGNPTIVGTICGSFVALVVLFSIIFLHENVSAEQLLVIVLIFFGVTLTSLDFRALERGKIQLDRSIIYALFTCLAWGVYFTFIKIPIRQVGWFATNYVSLIAGTVVLLGVIAVTGKKISPLNRQHRLGALLGATVLTGGATFAFNYALQSGNTAIVAPIAGSYPTLFVALSFYVFKERPSRLQWFGIVISLVGIVLLSSMVV